MRTRRYTGRPSGGIRDGTGTMHPWRWNGEAVPLSLPVRCAGRRWYLVRARSADGVPLDRAAVLLRFWGRGDALGQQGLTLHAAGANGGAGELLGWAHLPARTTHVQLGLTHPEQAELLAEVVLQKVAEREPGSHLLANVPRWDTYRPPFAVERVLLPPDLAPLAEVLTGQAVEIFSPRSRAHLAAGARGRACVLDPAWVVALRLGWNDLEQFAAGAWLVVDLDTTARLLRAAGLAAPSLVTWRTRRRIPSARVEYADVPTRGFALQDVFPCAMVETRGGFSARALRADRTWRCFAAEHSFVTLLSSDGSGPSGGAGVLSAARPLGRGQLVATDLPWLVAGRTGSLLAPRLARHALRMHLAGPLSDDMQYWDRWGDTAIVVRDIADLAGRYAPLRALRWAGPDPSVAHLGVTLPAADGAGSRAELRFGTGRIDHLALHDGLPPEPMIIFMKMLAREAREQTAWARRYLHGLTVTWQFDTAAGLRYALNYELRAAEPASPQVVTPRKAQPASGPPPAQRGRVELIEDDVGLLGDGALEFQERLSARLRRLIERAGTGPGGRFRPVPPTLRLRDGQ